MSKKSSNYVLIDLVDSDNEHRIEEGRGALEKGTWGKNRGSNERTWKNPLGFHETKKNKIAKVGNNVLKDYVIKTNKQYRNSYMSEMKEIFLVHLHTKIYVTDYRLTSNVRMGACSVTPDNFFLFK